MAGLPVVPVGNGNALGKIANAATGPLGAVMVMAWLLNWFMSEVKVFMVEVKEQQATVATAMKDMTLAIEHLNQAVRALPKD